MLNILIVDDDLNLCECLLAMLPWKEMQCRTPRVVHNGQDALSILHKESIDLIICDLKMPIMDGSELVGRIAQDGICTKIVFLTAYEDFSAARQGLRYGVSDYILKPINRENLNELAKIIASTHQMKQAREIYESMLSSENEAIFTDAIHNNDSSLFAEKWHKLGILQRDEMRSVGSKLLSIMYEYLCIAVPKSERRTLDNLYKKWKTELYQCADSETMVEYLQNVYSSQMEKIHMEKENDHIAFKIRQCVDDNFQNAECRVGWIANKLHINAAYAGRVFSKVYGLSLVEYITSCRMNEACRLLETESTPVGIICNQVGYTDVNYFIKQFRKEIGITPSEYRRRNIQ